MDANSESGQVTDTVALAFGCFHFGPVGQATITFTGQQYADAVRSALEAVPSVDDVHIDLSEGFRSSEISVEQPGSLREGQRVAPNIDAGSISFGVHIPMRIQRELERGELEPRTATEDFRVVMHHYWAVPVTMIHAVGAPPESSPSEGVRMVRSFLERELQKGPDSDLATFQYLGPSPFHANFFLSPEGETEPGRRFTLRSHRRAGYDHLSYGYDPSRFPTQDASADGFFRAVISELDLFYRIEVTENARRRTWQRVMNLIDDLVDAEARTGLSGTIRRIFGSARKMHRAFVELARFEAETVTTNSFLAAHYAGQYGPGSEHYLQFRVDEQMDERQDYPTAQMGQLLRLFEQRRLTDRELSVVLVAAGVGGVVGAVIAAAVG